MKKVMLILMLVVACATCMADVPVDEVTALRAELASTKAELNKIKYANTPAIEKQIEEAPADWKDAYGDTKETQLYFNIRSAWIQVNQCKTAIRHMADAITNITNPDDPNSLASRIGVLEAIVGEVLPEHSNLDEPGNTVIGAILMHTDAINQFRPQIDTNTIQLKELRVEAGLPIEGHLRWIETGGDEGFLEYYDGKVWIKFSRRSTPNPSMRAEVAK
ncbi:hypothetical protein LCGC14_1092980 [marine sediment metagenome]|uniref:Uncharacterized protein n=1 Tax=marine sediment metagenome TaxID=412755 RepID=A0A0F9MBW7_9ZZZZ